MAYLLQTHCAYILEDSCTEHAQWLCHPHGMWSAGKLSHHGARNISGKPCIHGLARILVEDFRFVCRHDVKTLFASSVQLLGILVAWQGSIINGSPEPAWQSSWQQGELLNVSKNKKLTWLWHTAWRSSVIDEATRVHVSVKSYIKSKWAIWVSRILLSSIVKKAYYIQMAMEVALEVGSDSWGERCHHLLWTVLPSRNQSAIRTVSPMEWAKVWRWESAIGRPCNSKFELQTCACW